MLPTELFLDPAMRWAVAAVGTLAYGVVCIAVSRREQNRLRQFAAVEPAAAGSPSCLVAFASQTGTAEEIALHTAQRLNLAGISAHLIPLQALTLAALQQCERALFVVSTYGEGNAPDNAARFEADVMNAAASLKHLHCGVLALGDATYLEYCGFGRRLEDWLRGCGVQSLFPCIEVDRGDATALNAWQQQLTHLAGSSDAPDWSAPAFETWRLQSRRLLNPGSAGAPLFELKLIPASGFLPHWQSGDLVQIQVPVDPARPRDYSIASVPPEGYVQLLVRLHNVDGATAGLASGWLTQTAEIGDSMLLRVRPHRLFRLEDNAARPLILIGNGSGLAGLRGHIKARIDRGQRANWLIYGERNAAADALYADELQRWHSAGQLQQLDRVFSRDGDSLRYVQDVVRERAELLCQWVTDGAAIYVCGSLQGMASGVDVALSEALGGKGLTDLKLAGRYRRDVY